MKHRRYLSEVPIKKKIELKKYTYFKAIPKTKETKVIFCSKSFKKISKINNFIYIWLILNVLYYNLKTVSYYM